MGVRGGAELLHAVAVRILVRFLEVRGERGIDVLDGSTLGRSEGIDISYRRSGSGAPISVKVKPDAYHGVDPALVADRSLVFYRAATDAYAFESISDHRTREPGWTLKSSAAELFYYRVAIAQPEPEVSMLMSEPDAVFFEELDVERDELHILPMRETREWFATRHDSYVPRPVASGDHSSWVRLVPKRDIADAVPGIVVVADVFEGLSPFRRAGSA